MNWITKLLVATWTITNDYSWFAINPAAHFALIQANCTTPSAQCLHQAKNLHRQLVEEHLELYWRTVAEVATKVEHEKQAKEAHNQYIAEQLAKGDKWDRWEVSPPTIINVNNHNFINPTFVHQTIVSTYTARPEIPERDIKAVAAQQNPSAEFDAPIADPTFAKASIYMSIKECIFLVLFVSIVYTLVRVVSASV